MGELQIRAGQAADALSVTTLTKERQTSISRPGYARQGLEMVTDWGAARAGQSPAFHPALVEAARSTASGTRQFS